MDKTNILIRLRNIFREVFDDDALVISEETSSEDFEEWDSIAHVKLVFMIEEEFGVTLELGEVSAIKSVGGFIEIIAKRTDN